MSTIDLKTETPDTSFPSGGYLFGADSQSASAPSLYSLSTILGSYAPPTLTGSAADSALSITQTWNTTGAPALIFGNVTDTASDSASLLMDLQVGSTSMAKITKQGYVTAVRFATAIDTQASVVSDDFIQVYGTGKWIGFSSSNSFSAGDTRIYSDAPDTIAQRRSTNAQTFNLYDTYASATDYHRVAIKTARDTLSAVSGASVTASSLIPAGAILLGLTTKVTTGLGTTNGTTGYTVGDGSDADRWGAITGTSAGTSSDNSDWTGGTVEAFTSAQDVVITATGGNFDGTGVIYVSAQYIIGECD